MTGRNERDFYKLFYLPELWLCFLERVPYCMRSCFFLRKFYWQRDEISRIRERARGIAKKIKWD